MRPKASFDLPEHVISAQRRLRHAMNVGKGSLVDRALAYGACPGLGGDSFWYAGSKASSESALRALARHHALPSPEVRQECFQVAVAAGCVKTAQWWLDRGATVLAFTVPNPGSLLQLAVCEGHASMVAWLSSKGARFSQSPPWTPLVHALDHPCVQALSLCHEAVLAGADAAIVSEHPQWPGTLLHGLIQVMKTFPHRKHELPVLWSGLAGYVDPYFRPSPTLACARDLLAKMFPQTPEWLIAWERENQLSRMPTLIGSTRQRS